MSKPIPFQMVYETGEARILPGEIAATHDWVQFEPDIRRTCNVILKSGVQITVVATAAEVWAMVEDAGR